MRIAVTGGGGFLGSATIAYAELNGDTAWRFDRSDGNDVLGDLKDLKDAECVIHMAGMLGTSELFDTPEEAVEANVVGTIRILEWCKKNNAGFVGITMPDSDWANVYQATKLCAKKLATAWHRNFSVPVSHVRAFNAFGPGQKHGPGHPQKFLPTWATLAWEGKPLPVWGSGEQGIDMVRADDVARMLVDATGYGDDSTFDAGTGTSTPVIEVVKYIVKRTGNEDAGILMLPMRKGEKPDTYIRASGEGWQKLGWKPTFQWHYLDPVIDSYKPDPNDDGIIHAVDCPNGCTGSYPECPKA
jgi:UDP-glucose 4-epimerase